MSRAQQSRQQGRGGAAAHTTAWACVALDVVVVMVRDRGMVAAISSQTAAQLAATAESVQKRARPNVTAAFRTGTVTHGGTRAVPSLLSLPMAVPAALDGQNLSDGV